MRLFTWQRRWLLLLAVGFAVLGLVGCGGEENPENEGGNGGGNNKCTSSETCRQVTIGTQVWMAENLNVATSSGSWCYRDSSSYCGKYGRLYNWETAMTVCPTGWHLPSREEWAGLVDFAGGYNSAGKKLKSTSGWNRDGNSTDEFGFSALPGGRRFYSGIGFGGADYNGYWWSATERTTGLAYILGLYYWYDNVEYDYIEETWGFSVRCVRD